MEALLFILLLFIAFAAIKYSMLIAFGLWRRRNSKQLYLYKIHSEPYEYITDDVAYNAARFDLTIPWQNFKSLYLIIKSIRENRITSYKQWVMDEKKYLDSYQALLLRAMTYKDVITTLGLFMALWASDILDDEIPDAHGLFYTFLKDNEEEVKSLLLTGVDDEMVDDISTFCSDMCESLNIEGKIEEAKWVARFINGIILDNLQSVDWLDDEAFKEMQKNVPVIRNTFQDVGCGNTYEAITYALENNAQIAALVVLYADWSDTGKGDFDDEIVDKAYELLVNTPNYRGIFSKEAFMELNGKLMDNYELRGMMDKVAELSEFNKDLDDEATPEIDDNNSGNLTLI